MYLKDACQGWDLPWDMRYDPVWKARMYQAAGAAVGRLRNGATLNEVKIAASEGVATVVQEFEHQGACKQMVESVWTKLSGDTVEEREHAKVVVRKALAQLPVGTSKAKMERTCENALEPIRAGIAAREDQATRDRILRWIDSRPKVRALSRETQEKVLEEARAAFNKLPEGTARATLDKAIDAIVDRYYSVHEQQENKKKEAARQEAERQQKRREAESKANIYIGHLQKYLEQEYEFGGGYSELRREAERLREPVRTRLIARLLERPTMDAVEIRRYIERLTDEDF